jgi:histidinol-phosphatase (PHP family)
MNLTSYHNHTNLSDGSASLTEMLAGAREAGVAEFGLSDHYVLPPSGQQLNWSMPLEGLDAYAVSVRAAMGGDLIVRLGIEADYFPETVADVATRLARYPFDYRIGSVHITDGFPIDADAEYWVPLDQDARNAIWRRYWIRLRELAESRVFDIVGHLDLPKKFGYLPTIDLTVEIDAVLDAIAAADMAIELNTAGWDKPIREAYPAPSLLRAACHRGIPLTITADAHAPDTVAAHYARAVLLAREAGYTSLVRFAGRQRTSVPLPAVGR